MIDIIIMLSFHCAHKYYDDSGSQYMLNSAACVMFPTPIEPPKNFFFSILDSVFGNSYNKCAKFVNGPYET